MTFPFINIPASPDQFFILRLEEAMRSINEEWESELGGGQGRKEEVGGPPPPPHPAAGGGPPLPAPGGPPGHPAAAPVGGQALNW